MAEFSYTFENRGLLVARPGDTISDGFWVNLLNGTSQKSGYTECRQGTSRVSGTNLTLVHSQGRQLVSGTGYNYQGAGTALYRNFSSISTGFSGNPFTFRDLAIELSGNPYIVAFDSTKRVKDTGSAVTNFGFPGGTAAASASAATAQTKLIDAFEYTTNGAIQAAWPSSSATITTTSVDPAVGTYAGSIAVAANTTGYVTRTVSLDLNQFSTPGDSDDTDPIIYWIKIDAPQNLVEIRLEFDVDPSTNDFTKNYYWKSIQSSQITPAVDQQVTAQTIRDQLITQAAFVDPSTLAEIDERVNQLLAEELAAGVNQWYQFSTPKIEFNRVGSSTNNWANVAKVRIQIQTVGAVNVGVDNFYLQGGTNHNLDGDYDWIYQYKNSTTGTRSPFAPAMTDPVTITHTRATVTVQNPPDTQCDYILLFRRGGDNPEDYLLSVEQVVSAWTGNATISDGVADADLGETAEFGTGSDQIELSNAGTSEIDPTFCEMHMDRCWVTDTNYLDRVWYSDRGASETFREDQFILSKSGQGDPVVRPYALDDQCFIFTKKTVKRISGSGPESFESLNTGAELGLFSPQAICKGENKIFYRTYDGIYAMTSSGYPSKISGDIDPLFHGELLDDQPNLVAVDPAYASSERMEYFDSKLRFSYTGTDGNRYELVRDYEADRWEQTDIGATSYLRLDDLGEIYAARSDGYVYIIDSGQTDNGEDISIEWLSRYFDFGVPDREKFITSLAIDADTGGQTVTAQLVLNNGDDTVEQSISSSERSIIQFPMTEEIRCRNWAFGISGDNGGVRVRIYKVTIYYEIAPPLTRRIDSYELDFGYTMWKFIRRLWVSGRSDGDVTVDIYVNGTLRYTDTFQLVATSGWTKTMLKLPPGLKGELFRFIFTSDDDFQIFLGQSDTEWHPLCKDRTYQRARLAPETN